MKIFLRKNESQRKKKKEKKVVVCGQDSAPTVTYNHPSKWVYLDNSGRADTVLGSGPEELARRTVDPENEWYENSQCGVGFQII